MGKPLKKEHMQCTPTDFKFKREIVDASKNSSITFTFNVANSDEASQEIIIQALNKKHLRTKKN